MFNSLIISGLLATVLFPKVAESIKVEPPVEVREIEVRGEILQAEITAYTSDAAETDDTPDITASGQKTRKGIIACPGRYAFGTKVIIEGEEYECQDRMNIRYRDGNRFDKWIETKEEAYKWGIRKLEVEIKHNNGRNDKRNGE